MNNFDDSFDNVQLTINGRKKRANKEEHSREKVKRAKHSSGGKISQISCKHDASKSHCCAEYLTGDDLVLNQDRFYASASKVEQDAYLLRLLSIQPVRRKRVTGEDRKRTLHHSVDFYLLAQQGRIRTCKATFCSVLEKYYSHYGRRDSPGRKYLPHELSIAKMHRLFKEQNHQQVSFSLYYSVFCSNFNLGFGRPATDVCSTCTQFRSRVQNITVTEEEKKVMAAEFILHRRRARQFYNLMNEVGESLTVCFDVMENLVLPRTPIGQAYYSRQLYLYVLGIVIHRNNGTQDKQDIHLFTWLESQSRKDSNMIASALSSAGIPSHHSAR